MYLIIGRDPYSEGTHRLNQVQPYVHISHSTLACFLPYLHLTPSFSINLQYLSQYCASEVITQMSESYDNELSLQMIAGLRQKVRVNAHSYYRWLARDSTTSCHPISRHIPRQAYIQSLHSTVQPAENATYDLLQSQRTFSFGYKFSQKTK